MGNTTYDLFHPNQARGQAIWYHQPWQFVREKTLILGAADHGLYRRLWAIRVCSTQWRVLIRSWATPNTAGNIQI
jgi:hypothetical protein